MLRYMVQLWSEQRKSRPTEPLVPVVPLLVYHGRSQSVRSSFAELFGRELPQTLTSYIPRFVAEVLNLTELPDSEIPPTPAPLSAGLWALKYARTQTEKTLSALDRLAATVGKALVEHETFAILKLYLIAASPYEPAELIEMVNRLLQTAFFREEVVNTAEKLKQEGRREGAREERRRTAERLLAREFSVAEVAEITGLTEAEVQAIAAQERE